MELVLSSRGVSFVVLSITGYLSSYSVQFLKILTITKLEADGHLRGLV